MTFPNEHYEYMVMAASRAHGEFFNKEKHAASGAEGPKLCENMLPVFALL